MAPPTDRERWPYRMKDLSEATGLQRQAIHFYIKEGLVPPGYKTGKNMAWYGSEHLQRLRLIRRLQEERFLPLKAIRAIIEDRDEAFPPARRRWLAQVKSSFRHSLASERGPEELVSAEDLGGGAGVSIDELTEMRDLGLIGMGRSDSGARVVRRSDAWVVELWGQLKDAGLTDPPGMRIEDLAVYTEAIAGLVRAETRMVADRLAGADAADASARIERALPLVNTFITRWHTAQLQRLLAALDEETSP